MKYCSEIRPLPLVWIALAVYCASFFAFYPSIFTVVDESAYVRQGAALANGSLTVAEIDPLTGTETHTRPSEYPIGTSLLMAIFIKPLGWKGAFLLPFISFVAVVLLLARWLLAEGRSPIYALSLFLFPPALVMGRVAMSDMPSTALVTAALWLLWTGTGARPIRWVTAGLIAGVSVMLRETNPLIFAPFVLGAVLRGEKNRWYLSSAFAAGLSMRLVISALLFGEMFFVKNSRASFSIAAIRANLLHFSLVFELLILGGLLFALAYHGNRRPEVLGSLICFLAIYSCYEYSGEQSGALKGAILGGRFYLPIIPLSIYGTSELFERMWVKFHTLRRNWSVRFGSGMRLLQWLIVLVACTNSILVHATMKQWSSSQVRILNTIYTSTPNEGVIVTNTLATAKFINELYGTRHVLDATSVGTRETETLLQRYGTFNLVILDRSDSDFWRDMSRVNQSLVSWISKQTRLELVNDVHLKSNEELRIWRVRSIVDAPQIVRASSRVGDTSSR